MMLGTRALVNVVVADVDVRVYKAANPIWNDFGLLISTVNFNINLFPNLLPTLATLKSYPQR